MLVQVWSGEAILGQVYQVMAGKVRICHAISGCHVK